MSRFSLRQSKDILSRTPSVLRELLENLDESWTRTNEGGDSWSPYDIVGHLVIGEQTDWMTRTNTILESGRTRTFEPFNRFAQFEELADQSLVSLLDMFESLRAKNLQDLNSVDHSDLQKTGVHPDFGEVTLEQLLAAWVVHDLGHIAQIARVMAKQYSQETGPWEKYLPVLHDRTKRQ